VRSRCRSPAARPEGEREGSCRRRLAATLNDGGHTIEITGKSREQVDASRFSEG
jgi:hypothetical protein